MTRVCLHELAQVKRFLELAEGDPDFRRIGRAEPGRRQDLLDQGGVDLRAGEIVPFWGLLDLDASTASRRAEVVQEMARHPLGALWDDWVRQGVDQARDAERRWQPTGDPRLRGWRQRQIARARSESLSPDDLTPFPLFAFELSKGCSTRCWFCALDPPSLQGHFARTPENRALWRGILEVAWGCFGPGCRTALCYHATEPSDNPDYFMFLEDVHDVFGVYPQTTTARPLRDLAWTRELPRLRGASAWPQDRFTVLSLAALREIHRTFSADELLNVGLVLQHPGSLSHKARAGRALRHGDRLEEEERLRLGEYPWFSSAPRETIVCTCGYLVNLVDRSIRLISPRNASPEWPLGFRIHCEGTFHDGASFREFLERSPGLVRASPGADDRLAFREDLVYEVLDDGFALRSRNLRHVVRGGPGLGLLGQALRDGDCTHAEVTAHMIRQGMGVLEAVGWVERLYGNGLLAEP